MVILQLQAERVIWKLQRQTKFLPIYDHNYKLQPTAPNYQYLRNIKHLMHFYVSLYIVLCLFVYFYFYFKIKGDYSS